MNREVFGAPGSAAEVDGTVDNIYVDLPPGVVGNPNAVPKCTPEQFAVRPLACPPETQLGIIRLFLAAAGGGGNNMGPIGYEEILPVFNLVPRKGNVAEIGFGYASGEDVATVRLVAKARTNGDFGVTAFAAQIPAALPLVGQSITLWGIPWAPANDLWRPEPDYKTSGCAQGELPNSGLTPACQVSYDPSWGDPESRGELKPFTSLETDCNPTPASTLRMDAYQNPGAFTSEGDPVTTDSNWRTYTSQAPAVTGCEKLGFDPDIDFEPTTTAADSASGLGVDLSIPQNNTARDGSGPPLEPPPPGAPQTEVDDYVAAATAYFKSDEGLATAHLKDTVVTLPDGLSVNPSGATGLAGCSDSGIGLRQLGDPPLFNNGDPFNKDGGADGAECPDASKIGTARVDTPLLDEPLTGDVVLGDPKSVDPKSGEMFRLFIVVRNEERGLLAKIYGTTVADGNIGEGGTGRLTATFRNNPELPFDNLRLDIKGGARGMVATPPRCGNPGWTSSFTPWSSVGAPVPVPDVVDSGTFAISANCAFGFAPDLAAGMDRRQGRGSGTFSFDLTRSDGEQTFQGITTHLPTGLLASVRDVPLCTSAQAGQNACPAASRIGFVDAAAGAGTPFVLEKKGTAYLTEGYKGAPYGLLVSVPAEAGPFRGPLALTPIAVRQAVHVDRKTAQVTAISDPLPQVWHGIPLRTRRITVVVDRPDFMRNPSDCSAKQIGASLGSGQGAAANVAYPFQAAGCRALAFKPRLALRLTGRRQVRTGRHPGIRALVRQRGIGEAGTRRAEVRLPKSLALDVDNAQALCEFEDGTKPDLENHCPRGSIVGRARAQSPLLNRPLAGNVYFVKNVRRDPDTGNVIRTLPMIVAALRGEIAVNLVGESDVKGGKLVSTFANVPDAPISQFNMNIRGGRNGILAVTRTRRSLINLCDTGRQIAEADMSGQNGKRHDFNVNMRKPCPRRRTAAQVCRKRTNTKPALRRCVQRVKANRAKAAKRKAAAKRKQQAAARRR